MDMQLLQKRKKKILESVLLICGVMLLCLFLPVCLTVKAETVDTGEHGVGIYVMQGGAPEKVDVVINDADHPAINDADYPAPKTGDATPSWIIISCTAVMLLSALVIVLIVFCRTKRTFEK